MRWRLARLLWATLAAAAMLTLMLELRIRPPAAIAATAVAMWAPEQSEVWHALTLSEGVAMPYALMGLICAARAARSARPLGWDVGGALFVLAALGCKNTFAAIVPAQMMLRVAPDPRDLREAWRRHGRSALFLASTLLLPLGHFALTGSGWHSGQYATGAPLPGQFSAMIRGVAKEAAFLLLPLALSVLALLAWGSTRIREAESQSRTGLMAAAAEGLGPLLQEYRGACVTGLLLLTAGIAIYIPVRLHNPGGRYSIPAAWGGDLWVAALLSTLFQAPAARIWKRAAYAALGLGIGALALANLAHQSKFAARARCLWQALELVEHRAAPNSCIGWLYGPGLARGEGIHFAWHLRARGNTLRMALIDTNSGRLDPDDRLRDLGDVAACRHPDILVSAAPAPPAGFGASAIGAVQTLYWFGTHRFTCYVWRPAIGAAQPRNEG